ncbi:MAG: sigma-70 family RNA polymerase sigma factor [Nannocystaceae bacterium]|nr:sigma-70 family RNA polymerase sigma factor [Nannocystaceae bacterium]
MATPDRPRAAVRTAMAPTAPPAPPPVDAASDAVLVAAWLAGDRSAGEALTRRHYPSVRRFFDLRLPQHADDLTQQVFVAATEGAASLRDGAALKPYLFGIARRLLLGHLRKAGRHDRAMSLAQDDSSARTSLSVVAVRREDEVLVLMALSTLPIDLQIVVELYYWEGMSTIEIGAVLEANPSTIGSRLARARELIVAAVVEMTRPGALRDRVVLGLDDLQRALGPATRAANLPRTP